MEQSFINRHTLSRVMNAPEKAVTMPMTIPGLFPAFITWSNVAVESLQTSFDTILLLSNDDAGTESERSGQAECRVGDAAARRGNNGHFSLISTII